MTFQPSADSKASRVVGWAATRGESVASARRRGGGGEGGGGGGAGGGGGGGGVGGLWGGPRSPRARGGLVGGGGGGRGFCKPFSCGEWVFLGGGGGGRDRMDSGVGKGSE